MSLFKKEKLWKNQIYHLLAYLLIGAFLYFYDFSETKLFYGFSLRQWVLFSWLMAGMFHAWVLFFWRLELYYGLIHSWLGLRGFLVFRLGFIILGLLRFLPLFVVCSLSAGTLMLPDIAAKAFIAITTPFILWGMYSVLVYFGPKRAFGADHFFEHYRKKPLETRGIYKFIPNSIYAVVLLALYHPGFLYKSTDGLLLALCHHIFIWVHYFCTEKPDLKEIYANE